MNTETNLLRQALTGTRSSLVFWGLFLANFSFFAVMTCVNIGWGGDPISLPAVVQAMEWARLSSLGSHEYFSVFAVAGVLVSVYSLVSSRKVRLALMVIGFFSPMLLIGPEMTYFIPFAPYIILMVLTGRADGEHFVEQTPEGGAVAMLMILYLVSAVCHVLHLLKSRKKDGGSRQFAPSKS